MHDRFRNALGMLSQEHGVDEVVVQIGMALFEGPRGIHQIDAVAKQREQPSHSRPAKPGDRHQQPGHPRPHRQSTSHNPVLGKHAEKQPRQQADGSSGKKGAPGNAAVVGRGCVQPLGEILLRPGGPLIALTPLRHRQRGIREYGFCFGCCRH